jgi:hypothetical protein
LAKTIKHAAWPSLAGLWLARAWLPSQASQGHEIKHALSHCGVADSSYLQKGGGGEKKIYLHDLWWLGPAKSLLWWIYVVESC